MKKSAKSKSEAERKRQREVALMKMEYQIALYRNAVLEAAAQIAELNPGREALAIRAAKDAVLLDPPIQTIPVRYPAREAATQ